MAIIILDIDVSKNNLKTNEQFTMKITAREITVEPVIRRLPFKLGRKGGIK